MIAGDEQFRGALLALEGFVPELLVELFPEWKGEFLDGILSVVARKTAECEVELFGACYLMSDQTLAPIHLRMQIAAASDEVSWLECRLGERGEQGLIRMTSSDLWRLTKRLYALDGRFQAIDWMYKVTYGERRHR